MIPYGWHKWRGETGNRWRFKITKKVEALPDAGGIYVMVKRTCFFFLSPVYIGKASNLLRRHSEHERWAEAKKKGASERHYLCVRSESKRQRIEEDMIRRYKPKLNRMLTPRSSEDAPNHKDLKRGWMSAKQYWSLNDKPRAKKAIPEKPKPKKRDYWGSKKKAA